MSKKIIFSIFLFSIASIILNHIIGSIFEYFGLINKLNGPKFINETQKILLVLVIAPLVETALYQALIYYLMKLFDSFLGKFYNFAYIVVSSFSFSIFHSYSIYYQIGMILPGALLAYGFLYFKKISKYPILLLSVVHFLHNLYILITE